MKNTKKTYPNKWKSWTPDEHVKIREIGKKCFSFRSEEKYIVKLAETLGRTPLGVKAKVHTYRTIFHSIEERKLKQCKII